MCGFFVAYYTVLYTIRKVTLKGRCMDNYLPEGKKNEIVNYIAKNTIKNCCQHKSGNSWYKHNED